MPSQTSSVTLLANVALAAASSAMAWSFNLKISERDDKQTLDREGCMLWYLFGVSLTGLVFNLVVLIAGTTNKMLLGALVAGWAVNVAATCAELAVVYSSELRGAISKRGVDGVIVAGHATFISSACITIVSLVFLARREVLQTAHLETGSISA